MYRKLEAQLLEWKQSKNHKPLVIKGARQVGKTYSILKFAKEYYPSVVYVNFERDDDIKHQFELSIQPLDLLNYLEVRFPQATFETGKTILILDEIQACSRAITALKFLAQECPYDIIASGSMLGVAIASSTSYPVGYVETLELLPMDFEEFLWANGISQKQIGDLKHHYITGEPILEGIHKIFIEYLKKYVICGGMPEVVQLYTETKSLANVRKKQLQIVDDYYRDMAKYADESEKVKVHECFLSIPVQLAKENKKFQYKLVRNGGNARYFESSLAWLRDNGLILKCTRVNSIQVPLEAYQELNIFKIYLFDTGLLLCQLDESCAAHILQDTAMIYKGALYENLAAQMLHARGKKLFYFEPSTRSEIDFLLSKNLEIIPIEIKASHNTQSKSLSAFVEKHQPSYAMKFSMNNINTQGNIKCYPLYMLMFV